MSFNPVPSRASVRAVLRAEKAGETTVDLSKKPNREAGAEAKMTGRENFKQLIIDN